MRVLSSCFLLYVLVSNDLPSCQHSVYFVFQSSIAVNQKNKIKIIKLTKRYEIDGLLV